MSELLEKLQVKPEPKKDKQVRINIGQINKPVEIKTKIVDKTKEEGFDKYKFMELIGKKPEKKQLDKKIFSIKPQHSEEDNIGSSLPDTIPVIKKGPQDLSGLKKLIKVINDDKTQEENKKMEKIKKKMGKKGSTITALKTAEVLDKKQEEIISLEILKDLEERIPKKENIELITSNYFMNNREFFINFINTLFKSYKQEIKGDITNKESDYFVHQRIIREYLLNYTPYRGLLIYHGLGAGKTCGSIAIAESLKNTKEVMILTPASLRMNYLKELKKCGDELYKINQHWEWIRDDIGVEILNKLASIMNLNLDFVKQQGGIWFVNVKKEPNYESLSNEEKNSLNNQIEEQIHTKYRFINYNGLRSSSLNVLSSNGQINPFTNKVVIIDEAHNFVSRISNKLKKKSSLSMKLYEFLLSADNCKIVLLTGTPIINYPNEIGILFNILRGYIKTWHIPLDVIKTKKIDQDLLEQILSSNGLTDYINYKVSSKEIEITRNPFGFINVKGKKKYTGVYLNEQGNISDGDYIEIIIDLLNNNNIEVFKDNIKLVLNKALPDNLKEFKERFIKGYDLINNNLLKRRIIGLTSYFRSAKEELMPRYNENTNFHIITPEMSDYQFSIYEKARSVERDQDKKSNKIKIMKSNDDDIYDDVTSTYRIFSRAFCNFVFPETIKRPLPREEENQDIEDLNEDDLDNPSINEKLQNPDGVYTTDDVEEIQKQEDKIDTTYNSRIITALQELSKTENIEKYLIYDNLFYCSPKFAVLLENIQRGEGLHLVYSQFRTLEGIGIFSLVLKANGYAEFKIYRNEKNEWNIKIDSEDITKPKFALYTGTEEIEEKEIIRNIYNSEWNNVPENIVKQLKLLSNDNLHGDIIKILMITSSGAEGIDLKNTRHVHIMEPYWHPVRIEQVIGRANRIGSHLALPEEERTVDAYIYIMKFTKKQIESEKSIELRLKDRSKLDNTKVFTTDESLFEISNIKKEINKQILRAIKETSIDCSLHKNKNEKIKCFTFGKVEPSKFAFKPNINGEESDQIENINKKQIVWKAKALKINGIKRIMREDTKEIYDYDEYMEAKDDDTILLLPIGRLEIGADKKPKFISNN